MIVSPFLFLALSQSPAPPHRDPRTQPLSPADAVRTVDRVCGQLVLVRDSDGDGMKDLVVARGSKHGRIESIDLLSLKTGALIRTLWRDSVSVPLAPSSLGAEAKATTSCSDLAKRGRPAWDAGGDTNKDGHVDVLVSVPDAESQDRRVEVISGKDGSTLWRLQESGPHQNAGTALCWMGDVNKDGHDDFAFSATQYNRSAPFDNVRITNYSSQSSGSGTTHYVTLEGGGEREQRSYWQERLSARSEEPGYVSVRSGQDGAELWRAEGSEPGHAFGLYMRSVGDLDGDGAADVTVQCDFRSDQPLTILSGRGGARIATLRHRLGTAGPAGDVDGDGVPDLFLDQQDGDLVGRTGSTQFVSGRTRTKLFELPYPDWWTEYAVTVGVGDLDGDGFGDVAIGDGNFNVLAEGSPGYTPEQFQDPATMTLAQAVAIESNPWCSFTWESGCAIVYSGKTKTPLMGVWAAPGTRKGLGLNVLGLPDVTGDGHPDLSVTDQDTAYVFAGPGPAAK